MANYKSERELNFENLDGENITYILKKDERLLEAKCPLDQTYLIQKNESINCPACGVKYYNLSPQSLNIQMNCEIDSTQKRLENLEKEKFNLENS